MSAPKIVHNFAVYNGRQLLGHILESDDGTHQAMTADGEVIGTFRKWEDASRAIGTERISTALAR